MMCSSLVSSLLNRDYLQGRSPHRTVGRHSYFKLIQVQLRYYQVSSSVIKVSLQHYRKAFVFSLEIKPIQVQLKYYQFSSIIKISPQNCWKEFLFETNTSSSNLYQMLSRSPHSTIGRHSYLV